MWFLSCLFLLLSCTYVIFPLFPLVFWSSSISHLSILLYFLSIYFSPWFSSFLNILFFYSSYIFCSFSLSIYLFIYLSVYLSVCLSLPLPAIHFWSSYLYDFLSSFHTADKFSLYVQPRIVKRNKQVLRKVNIHTKTRRKGRGGEGGGGGGDEGIYRDGEILNSVTMRRQVWNWLVRVYIQNQLLPLYSGEVRLGWVRLG